jgi:hypothetical protein
MQDDAELVKISRSDDVEGFFSGVNLCAPLFHGFTVWKKAY